MHKALYIIFFLFLLLIPPTTAIVSNAIMEIANSPPVVELIHVDLDKNDLTVKAKVKDPNGYKDIQSVEVSIVYMDNKEKVYERFGKGYKKAALDSAEGAEALYIYTFRMSPTDSQGIYRVKVRAKDKEGTAESTADYEFPQETITPAGAFIAVRKSGANVLNLLKNIFGSIINWFK